MIDKECPTCEGDGWVATSHKFTCYSCKGSGRLSEEAYKKAYEAEMEMTRNLNNSVRIAEYRAMGG